ncbi:FkbM family methyltransferase [Marinigracilibium pacificum]|uniref:FkbM family methyltransferase n=1 Tax=Marinigracilibium pacificum TaxID=2729599 RepID=A0A848J0Y4_9BACT|nr:FkbM family methyltransferase [Marinigracilibium pacificum]NMM48210.1 FkbM family methyltransferase [Marinigracilibium pacificum]
MFNSFKEILKRSLNSRSTPFSKSMPELVRLYFLSYLNKKNEKPVVVKFRGLNVVSPNYPLFINLINEIFYQEVYANEIQVDTPLIIDAGSNIGISILYFKSRYPDSEIIGIEPDPQNFNMLKENVSINGFENIKLINCALGSSKGETVLYKEGGNPYLNPSILKVCDVDQGVKVRLESLTDIISNRDVDLLKMDIEGAEMIVLKDIIMSGAINKVNSFVLETHPDNGVSSEEVKSLLIKSGFEVSVNPLNKNIINAKRIYLP